jgi:C-terminal processing protease CtpA/Prc
MKLRGIWIRGAALSLCLVAPWALAEDAAQEAEQAEQAQAQAQGELARMQAERELAEAQRRLEAAAREVAELSSQVGNQASRQILRFYSGAPGARALLGVQVDGAANTSGARVTAVSPGGAAEEAGIKVGDVITSIGGAALPAGADASRALVDRMRELEPGVKVKVAVLRDGKKQEFDVTPRAAPAMAFGGRPGIGPGGPVPDGPGGPRTQRFEFRGPPGDVRAPVPANGVAFIPGVGFDDGTRFAGMEFATLSERLGSYFCVKSGVLVVRAGPADGPWKLQDGDVILSIDGRTPTSAAHAGRILRSYTPGEKVKLRVQRDRRAQDIEVSATGGVRDFRLEHQPSPVPAG